MELLYTLRYKINLLFSLVMSGFLAGMVLLIIPHMDSSLNPNVRAIAGVVSFVLPHLFFTRKYRRRKKVLLGEFPKEWEDILSKHVDFYVSLSREEQDIFRKKVLLFLSEKHVTGVGVDMDNETRVLVASSAIIPVFKIEDWEYDMVNEILVYPDSFDRDFNQEGEERNVLGMVIANTSSIIISKKSLFEGFARNDGNNTGIHEFLHKIDESDGAIDGLPGLMLSKEECRQWRRAVHAEMASMERGLSDFNPYGLTNEAEFFAVAGEYFFEKPQTMREKHPRLYRLMKRAFRQDERFILKNEIVKTIVPGKGKTGRNAPCPCGSGKKYKKCCMGKND